MPSSASNLTNAKRVEFRTRMLIGQMTAVGRLGLPAIFAVGPFLLLNRTFSPHRQGLKSAIIPEEPAAPSSAPFPAISCLALFGRRPLQRVEGSYAGGRKLQEATYAPQQTALFDHLVSKSEKLIRYVEA